MQSPEGIAGRWTRRRRRGGVAAPVGRAGRGYRLVRAVAVLGDGASLTEAARLAGVSEEEVVRAADLPVALAILKPAEGLEFAHPIVREAVYADIGPHERAETHARAARSSPRAAPRKSGSRFRSPRRSPRATPTG